MPATSLSCRVCATEHPLESVGSCTRCFGPLDPVYDLDRLRAEVTRERIAAGPASIWRYADLLPVDRPPSRGSRPASRRSSRRHGSPSSSASASSGSSSTPRTRRTRSRTASSRSPRAKAQELGLTTLACSSTGNLAGAVAARAAAEGLEAAVFVPADLEPEKLTAAAATGRRSTRSTATTTTAHGSRSSSRSSSLGLRQRQPALLLRRGLQDARLRDRRATRLAPAGRRRCPDRVGRAVPQGRPGIRASCARSG